MHMVRSAELPLVLLFNRLLAPLVAALSLPAIGALFGIAFTREYLVLAAICFLVASQVFGELNLFRSWREAQLGASVRDILFAWLIVFAILLFLGYATKFSSFFSRRVLLSWFVLSPLALAASQFCVRYVLLKMGATRLVRSAVIVGAGRLGVHFAREIEADSFQSMRIKGFFDDRAPERLPGSDKSVLSGKLEDLPQFVKQNKIHTIYITLPMSAQPRTLKLLDALKDTTASIYFVPDVFVFNLLQAHLDRVGKIPVIAVCETPFTGLNGLIKRFCDIVIAMLMLVLLAPLMLAIAIGVRLSSSGPIVFKQRRYGLDGREIVVYKFRSMTVCEDGAVVAQARKEDERVTRFGAFLRRTSLDELPQFFNVLQGRMSIVGPRPHAVAHNEQYRKLIKGYMLRHKVKPGITGWAQIHGLRGETETVDKMHARIEYDLDYLKQWSVFLDLWIMLRTVGLIYRDSAAH
jgi:putative colanic acid biosysnthesis UDP-glucose lipid carrier transferase